jgi:N-acetylmuramoyl-L-alanine amidase
MIPIQVRDRPSPNHSRRSAPPRIDMLVLHYTGMTSAAAAIERLCDPDAKVSAHYVVEENGRIWRLVPETRRAFHAGRSCWQGESDLNAVSVGIEIVNPGHEWGYRLFPEMQMTAVERLCQELVARHSIPPHRVVGHSDIAPDRKSDPGELFDWPRLARAGVGIWPPPRLPRPHVRVDHARLLADLVAIGYCATAGSETPSLIAFQRRFRPSCCDGRLDPETATRLAEVREAVAQSRASPGRAGSDIEIQQPLQSLKVDRAVPHPR